MSYWFADNNNNDTKKVYYGGFKSELEAKLYKAYHSNTNEQHALVEWYTEEDIQNVLDDPGRAKWYFRKANKASYPLSYKEVKKLIQVRLTELIEKEHD